MAAESNIGTSKISLELDLSTYSASVETAKRQLGGLSDSAGAAFSASNSKAQQAAVGLAKYINLIGKTADETKLLRAQWSGINVDVLDDLASKLEAVRQEEAVTNANAKLMTDSFAAMQVKARAAFSELQSAAREDQLRLDQAAAADVNRQLQLIAETNRQIAVTEQNLATARSVNAASAQSAYQAQLTSLQALRTAQTDALTANVAANKTSSQSSYERQLAALQAERAQEALNATTRKGGIEFNQYGLSAKQQLAALRQVPAQITDIVVSLQGGQRPMTVLLQQGGQLKDVFGGVVPAVKALSSALLGLLANPVVLLTAAVAGLAYAWKTGSDEGDAYAQSIALTGNYAGKSKTQLDAMAASIGANVSNQHAVAAALALVAGNGKLTADNFELITTSAEAMRVATGKAVKDTVAEFATFADDPVKAIAKLNESQHFLTAAVFEQIAALQQQGRTRDAQSLAEKTYAEALSARATNIVENLGYVEKAWRGVADATKTAISAAAGLGRMASDQQVFDQLVAQRQKFADDIDTINTKLANNQIPVTSRDFAQKQLGTLKAQQDAVTKQLLDMQEARKNADIKATHDAALQRANDGAIALQQEATKYLPAEKKRANDIAAAHQQANDLIAGLNTVSDAALIKTIRDNEAKVVAGLNAKGAAGARSLDNAGASAQLQSIKDTQAQEQAVIQNSTKLLQSQYSARLISTTDYYTQQKKLVEEDTASQEKSLTAQIAYLKQRDVAGKDGINVGKQIGEAEAKLAKVRLDGATAQQTLAIEEGKANTQRDLALRSYTEALQQSEDAAKSAADAAVARISMGDKEADQQEKISAIRQKAAQDMKALARDEAANPGNKELYDAQAQALQDSADRQVQIVQQMYADMDTAQSNWLNGVRAGIANWMDQTANVATQTSAITGRVLDKGADAFTTFAETGKLDIKGLLSSIADEVTKFMAKQAILKFIQLFLGSATSTSTSTSAYAGQGGVNSGFNAKGNVFDNSPDLSSHSGTVVSTPTFFTAYAKGGNVMGEAGPEGIFPLQRDSQGRLGITAAGGGSNVALNMNFTVNNDGTSSSNTDGTDGEQASLYKAFMGEVGQLVESKINRAMLPGGKLWKVGVSAS